MFGDMFNKIQQMKEEVAKSKLRLESISVDAEFNGIQVCMNGNRKLKDISIPESLLDDKEALEDSLLTAFNRCMEKAEKVNEAEMAGAAKGLLPNMPFGL